MAMTLVEIADQVFSEISDAMRWVAENIDRLESMDDFELVDMYAVIDDINTRTSFLAVTNGMFSLADDSYNPTQGEYREYIRRYDQLTKHHPTNAYRRFRAIADDMDDKWTAVEAIRKDRSDRAAQSAKKRLANDPKAQAMLEIREAWEVAHRPGASFAKEMAMKYQTAGIDLSEGGIKNAIGRWRKESSS